MKPKPIRLFSRAAVTLLVALLGSVTGAWAQSELTVYDGTDKNQYIPFNAYFADYGTRSQFIIPADKISEMAGGSISALKFYCTSSLANFDEEFTVYLKEVEYTTFATEALEDWVSMADVYTGTLTVNENQLVIEFDSPYTYLRGNLMIGFQITTWGSKCPSFDWYGKKQESTTALYNNASKSHDWGSSNTSVSFLPKTTFTYTPVSGIVCSVPTLSVDDITTNGATLTVDGGSGTYNVQYKLASADSWTDVALNTTNTSFTLTGLTPSSAYNVRVQSVCDGDATSRWRTVSFNTDFGAPWTEDFNGLITANSIPSCWDNSDGTTTGNGHKWCYNTSTSGNGATNGTSHDGSKCVRFNSFANTDGNTNFLKTPVLSLPANTPMELNFWYKNPAGGDFSVYISTDGGNTYTTALATGLTDQTSWTKHDPIDLSDYAGQEVVIVFKGTSNYANGDAYIYLDDVTVKAIPTCLAPTALGVDNITSTSADLSWTSDASAWTVYYKKSTDVSYTEVANVTENPYTLEGLDAASHYQFYVVANCSATDASEPSGVFNFTTECAPYDIPYTYGFEEAAPFDCWTVISGNIECYEETPNTGSYRLDFRGTTSNMIALPQFTEPINTLRVEFYTRPENNGGNSGKFAIGYMTDITDASTFVAVATYNSTEMTTNYVKKAVDFASAPANAIIAMRQFDCKTNYYWFVDDVTVKAMPSCLAPTALRVENITTTSADLSWTSDADAWTVYYKKTTDVSYTEVTNVTENPYTLNGLDASSYYQFYVVANCSATDASDPSDVFKFNTDYEVVTAYPWTENFDEITVVSAYSPSCRTLPLCWSYINESTTTSSYQYYPTIFSYDNPANSSPNCLRFYSYCTEESDPQPQYAILPPMENLAGKQVRLMASGYNSRSTFKIGTMSDPTDASTFTMIAEQNGLTTSYPEDPFEYIIPDDCTDRYLAIMIDAANSSRAYNIIYIDDIVIREVPTCIKPTGLVVADATKNSATLSWTPGEEGQDAWQICLNGDEEHLIDANSNPFTVDGLDPDTDYTVKVRANCGGGDYSDWSKAVQFNTVPDCQTPDGLQKSDVTTNSAKITWNTYCNDEFVLQYKADDDAEWTEVTGYVNSPYTLDNVLTPCTGYTVRVRAYCADDDTWSDELDFRTKCEPMTITAETYVNEGFEDYEGTTYNSVGVIPYRWDNYTTATYPAPHVVKSGGSYAYVHNGEKSLNFECSAHSSAYAALPELTNDLNTLMVSFWMKTESTTNGKLTLGYITAEDNNYDTYQVIKEYDNTTTMTECNTYLELKNVPKTAACLVFRWSYDGSSWYGCCIDDVVVKLPPVPVDITLAEDATDNATTIEENHGVYANVTLDGRTLYKDGYWNTLCLPFDVEDGDDMDEVTFSDTPLEGATVKELNATASNLAADGTLTLNFSDDLTAIEAGKPYLIKWTKADDYDTADPETRDVKNPVFTSVTISSIMPEPVVFTGGSFVGQYSPFSIDETNINSVIMLSSGSRLGYSNTNRTLRSFRAHFEVPAENPARNFVLDFGDGTTSMHNSECIMHNGADAWYSLDGRKLDNVPTKKGVYIVNGQKVVIK